MKLQNAGPLQWIASGGIAGSGGTSAAVRPAVTGVVHVCTGFVGELTGQASGGSIANWVLADGSTIIARGLLGVSGIGFTDRIAITGLNIPGTAGNSMTFEVVPVIGLVEYTAAQLIGYDL